MASLLQYSCSVGCWAFLDCQACDVGCRRLGVGAVKSEHIRSKHIKSKLVCSMFSKVMDGSCTPMVLSNGYVCGKIALQAHAGEAMFKVSCKETGEMCTPWLNACLPISCNLYLYQLCRPSYATQNCVILGVVHPSRSVHASTVHHSSQSICHIPELFRSRSVSHLSPPGYAVQQAA